MEKTIVIDGREIPFKATGNTPRLYRMLFHRDIFRDIAKLSGDMQKAQSEADEGSPLNIASLEVFENIAYVMAKQANNDIPDIDKWLDEFNVFSVYNVLPEIIELWNLNMVQISDSKKNIETLTAR